MMWSALPDYFTYSQPPSPENFPAFGGKYQKSMYPPSSGMSVEEHDAE